MEPVLIAAGAVPPHIINPDGGLVYGSELQNEWGTEILINAIPQPGGRIAMTIGLMGIPRSACMRLATVDQTGTGRFTDGITRVAFISAVAGSNLQPPITPALAAQTVVCGNSESPVLNVTFTIRLS